VKEGNAPTSFRLIVVAMGTPQGTNRILSYL
jgi:hypothetical protein